MNPFEYVTIALAAAAVVARLSLFLPRTPKGPYRVM